MFKKDNVVTEDFDDEIVDENNETFAAEVIKKPAKDWLTEQYLPYAMYAIRSRALVADDGLKPVNRRILFSMYKDGITPNAEFLKAARAAASAVAYHPHGSSSVEDALSRMAQNFTLRVPLIEAYGSVGFVTGDTPAAARYWESRLSRASMELLKELPEGAVPIGKNFDGKLDEPGQLPVRWPQNIINGTQGIAVGYASNMYAHNPDEVMKAVIALLKNPDLTVDKLLKIMPGPDLPTGGELFEIDGVKDYYETGSGRFTLRGRYNIEQMTRGKVRIVFYELPYQISADNVIDKIRKAQAIGKLKDIAVVKDLTDKKNGLKLIIETKAGTNHLTVLADLFKLTPAENKYAVNSTVLIDGIPKQIGMLSLLQRFIDFRRGCVARKAETRINKIDARVFQLKGLLSALVDIDKCIAIIRKADTAEIARTQLMKTFKIEAEQAEYILSMQLRKLTRADSIALQKESDELLAERAHMDEILHNQEKLDNEVEASIRETLKVITDKRRTVITGKTTEDFKEESRAVAQEARDVNKNLPCYVTRFANGTIIKTSEPFTYTKTLKKWRFSPIIEQLKMKTQDELIVVGSDGNAHKIPLSYVAPEIISKTTDIGVNFGKGVKLVALAKPNPVKTDIGLLLATRGGEVKIVNPATFTNKETFTVFKLTENDEIISGEWLSKTINSSHFVSISSDANILIYPTSGVRTVGAGAGGVRSQKLKEGSSVVYFGLINDLKADNLMILSQGNHSLKLTPIGEIPLKGKGAQGVALHKFKPNETKLVNAFVGNNIIVGAERLNNSIMLPPASKRATLGVDFNIPTLMGSHQVEAS